MDYREPLKKHTVLSFEGMNCYIQEMIGCGSNAVVYRGWYPDLLNPEQRHHVLIKELFPFHPREKIRRGDNGAIVCDPDAQAYFETHRQSFVEGNEIHLRLLADHPDRLGANLNSFAYNGTLYSVLGYHRGRSLQEELAAGGGDLRRHTMCMLELLEALEAFHKSGFLHLDISPDNMMLTGDGDRERMFLIDYNSARRIGQEAPGFLSRKEGYSPPEVENGDENALGFPSDLYAVAAVFFRCIMGRSMTLEERLRSKAPDGKDSPCLAQAPQTVARQVERILRKGLHTLPQKRYQSIGQMRTAFSELLDRIDGVGITHWSLWENGKRSVENRMHANPALGYLTEGDKLYPIRLEREGSRFSLPEYLAELTGETGSSGLLLGEGGTGKSTLLLRSAVLLGRRYSPGTPAVFYVNLNGFDGADSHYIRNQILRSLRFRRGENTYDSALHRLTQLLAQPLKTKTGTAPCILLLLDGMNEVRRDSGLLVQEIRELDDLAGVRILATSRGGGAELGLSPLRMVPLEQEDIAGILGQSGLLLPRNPSVQELLRTPLILSLYIRAGTGGEQPQISSREELMDVYLESLYQKELRTAAETTPDHWQIDVAVQYLLPCIAAEEKRLGGGLSEPVLLKITEGCWRFLHSRRARKAFPQWIGHSRELFADARTPDQWMGRMVYDILWRRMGLLLREPSGVCRVYHQVLRDHLAEKPCTGIARREKRRRLAGMAVALGVSAALLLTLPGWNQYDTKTAQLAVDYASAGYAACGNLYQRLQTLVAFARKGEGENFFDWYDRCLAEIRLEAQWSETEELYRSFLTREMRESPKKTVPWSGEPFAGELAEELLGLATERAAYYEEKLPLLARWMSSSQAREACPEFAEAFFAVLEADAAVMSELYHQTCAPHLAGGGEQWQENIRELIRGISALEEHRVLDVLEDRAQYLKQLRQALSEAENTLSRLAVAVQYSVEE